MRTKFCLCFLTIISVFITGITTYYIYNNTNINQKYLIRSNINIDDHMKQIEVMKKNNQEQLKNLAKLKIENIKFMNDLNNIRKTYLRLHTEMNAIGCISKNVNEPLPIVKRVIEKQEEADINQKMKIQIL